MWWLISGKCGGSLVEDAVAHGWQMGGLNGGRCSVSLLEDAAAHWW